MATINHKTYNEATETFKDFNVYDGKETLIFKVDGSTGNVGIGTSAPAVELEIFGTGNTLRLDSAANQSKEILLRNVGSGTATLKTDGDLKLYVEDAGKNILFDTTSGEKVRITSAGNVGIGTSNPYGKLDIIPSSNPTTPTDANQLTVGEASSNSSYNLRIGYFLSGGAYRGSIQSIAGGTPNTLVLNGDGGNVGIGTSSPYTKLEVLASATANLTANAYYSVRFLQDKTNYRGVFLGYDTTGTVGIIGAESASPASALAFYTYSGSSWGERARVTTNGLTFNGDTAAANALDDYEEGTWTPQLQIGGSVVGITYNIQSGKYTKIGRKVSVNCYIVLTSKGTNTGTARLYGLPFTIPDDNQNYSAGSFYNDGNITYTGQVQAFGNKNSTSIVLGQVTEAGSASNLTDSNLANNSAFMISLTYFVS